MSLFFQPKHKAQKDRATLKKIDQTLSRQGLPSALLHFGLFIVLEAYIRDNVSPIPDTVYFFGFALIIMAAWRFVMIAQFENWYSRGPTKWRERFILSGILHAGIWSSYLGYRLFTATDHPILLLGILYTSAIAAGGTFVYSLYGNTVRVYLAILFLPVAVYYLGFQNDSHGYVIGVSIIGLYAYLVMTASRLSELVWSFLKINTEFKLRLTALEQAREATTVEKSSNRRFVQQILLRLKTPLSGLLGVLGMLSSEEQDQENSSMLTIARRSGFSILDLMSDLEAFIEQRDQTRVPKAIVFNLRKTLEHTLADMGPKAHEHGRELSYLYHPEVPERIESDPTWLSNAFRRMLDFALDSAEQGEITVKIGIDTEKDNDLLVLSFYFMNNEMEKSDLSAAVDRQMAILPEDEDISDQLTLMVSTAQFKAMGAKIYIRAKGDLKTIEVQLPIKATTQQASSFKPSKHMSGRSIILVDLSPLSERALNAEFLSWNMEVQKLTLEQLLEQAKQLKVDFVLVNLSVEDQKALSQIQQLNDLSSQLSENTHLIIYASELQRNIVNNLSVKSVFIEKPAPRDQLLHALRNAIEVFDETTENKYICEKQVKVLIAEDNLLNQRVLIAMLEQMGAEVEAVVNGHEAIARFTENEYAIVLMDCYMPRLDGLLATKEIRQIETKMGTHIPIIAMTSEQSAEQEREYLAAGMDDFLSKPLQYEELVSVMQRWTSEKDVKDA
ncbi:response regulator [Reinekea sp.]|jgi:CheY-like chemotaxis protein/signal transduction histidine kinase|uniref:ATP-binding response regulator n=1 Tax=Reinekea sp. TaxID=1970455 RepID=UPI003989D6B1